MSDAPFSVLTRAIEDLVDIKLVDALRPDGVVRLAAHRGSGVASPDVRLAERRLEGAIAALVAAPGASAGGRPLSGRTSR